MEWEDGLALEWNGMVGWDGMEWNGMGWDGTARARDHLRHYHRARHTPTAVVNHAR